MLMPNELRSYKRKCGNLEIGSKCENGENVEMEKLTVI